MPRSMGIPNMANECILKKKKWTNKEFEGKKTIEFMLGDQMAS